LKLCASKGAPGLRLLAVALMLTTIVWNGGLGAMMPSSATIDDQLEDPGAASRTNGQADTPAANSDIGLTGVDIPPERSGVGAETEIGGRQSPICAELARSALENDVPLNFFTRLIWQESRFNPRSVSRAGALGIAQFMPETARLRGLANPFDPKQALLKSAELLRDLINRFGNPGLAAAAYNAGPGRVIDWLAGRKQLPRETRAYVRIVTGLKATDWTAQQAAPADSIAETASCETLASRAGAELQHIRRVRLAEPATERKLARRTRFPASMSLTASRADHRHVHQAHLLSRPPHGARPRHV
jgi:hypothetical protein